MALAVHHAGEAGLVGLDPLRLIVRQAVLPACHPEEDQPQMAGAGRFQLIVDEPEVELALLRLDQVPGDDAQDGIEVHLGQAGEGQLHGFSISGTGIGQLAGHADERPPIDDELRDAVALLQVGQSAEKHGEAAMNAIAHANSQQVRVVNFMVWTFLDQEVENTLGLGHTFVEWTWKSILRTQFVLAARRRKPPVRALDLVRRMSSPVTSRPVEAMPLLRKSMTPLLSTRPCVCKGLPALSATRP